MLEPSIEDQQTAVIVTVHRARELLSEAFRAIERSEDDAGSQRAVATALEALPLLEGAAPLARVLVRPRLPDANPHVGDKTHDLLARAIHATRAAVEHGHIALSYATRRHSDWDQRYVQRARQIWARSTEAALQETHRALAELAELLPNGYETEET